MGANGIEILPVVSRANVQQLEGVVTTVLANQLGPSHEVDARFLAELPE